MAIERQGTLHNMLQDSEKAYNAFARLLNSQISEAQKMKAHSGIGYAYNAMGQHGKALSEYKAGAALGRRLVSLNLRSHAVAFAEISLDIVETMQYTEANETEVERVRQEALSVLRKLEVELNGIFNLMEDCAKLCGQAAAHRTLLEQQRGNSDGNNGLAVRETTLATKQLETLDQQAAQLTEEVHDELSSMPLRVRIYQLRAKASTIMLEALCESDSAAALLQLEISQLATDAASKVRAVIRSASMEESLQAVAEDILVRARQEGAEVAHSNAIWQRQGLEIEEGTEEVEMEDGRMIRLNHKLEHKGQETIYPPSWASQPSLEQFIAAAQMAQTTVVAYNIFPPWGLCYWVINPYNGEILFKKIIVHDFELSTIISKATDAVAGSLEEKEAIHALRIAHSVFVEPVSDLLPLETGGRVVFVLPAIDTRDHSTSDSRVLPFGALVDAEGLSVAALLATSIMPSVHVLAMSQRAQESLQENESGGLLDSAGLMFAVPSAAAEDDKPEPMLVAQMEALCAVAAELDKTATEIEVPSDSEESNVRHETLLSALRAARCPVFLAGHVKPGGSANSAAQLTVSNRLGLSSDQIESLAAPLSVPLVVLSAAQPEARGGLVTIANSLIRAGVQCVVVAWGATQLQDVILRCITSLVRSHLQDPNSDLAVKLQQVICNMKEKTDVQWIPVEIFGSLVHLNVAPPKQQINPPNEPPLLEAGD